MKRAILLCLLTVGAISCQKDIKMKNIAESEILIKQDSCYCFLPNAFSPDNNANNDILIPLTKGVLADGYTFTVRDKKQKILFTTSTQGEGWIGDNLPVGIYIATVSGTFKCGDSFEKHTCVNLIKGCIGKDLDEVQLIFGNMFDVDIGEIPERPFPSNEKKCD